MVLILERCDVQVYQVGMVEKLTQKKFTGFPRLLDAVYTGNCGVLALDRCLPSVIDISRNMMLRSFEAICCCCLQTCNSCMFMVFVDIVMGSNTIC